MEQLDLKKHAICKYVSNDDSFLYQWYFNEQIEKLARLLLYTSKNSSRKFHARVHFVPSQ